jgi:hypothetical protein
MAKVVQIPVIFGFLTGAYLGLQPAGLAQQTVESHVVPLEHSS